MPDEKFRLPGSSYAELAKIIKAYNHAKPDSSVEDVAKLAIMNRTTISRSTVFLTAVGIIRGGHKKTITAEGKALAQALDHNIPDEIGRTWRPLTENHEYFQKLLAAVRIRNGMDITTLLAHAAYTAGQGNTPDAKTGASAVIDILRAADLVVEKDGKLFVGSTETNAATPATPLAPDQLPPSTISEVKPLSIQTTMPTSATAHGLNINLNIEIHCTVEQLQSLSAGVRTLLADLSRPGEQVQVPGEQQVQQAE